MRNEIVKYMPNEEYHKHEGISNSAMGYLLDCPARYFAEYLDPNAPEKKTPKHYRIGSAVHKLVLEPTNFGDEYAIELQLPEVAPHVLLKNSDRQTFEADKERYAQEKLFNQIKQETFDRDNAGKTILTKEEFKQIEGMAASLCTRVKWLAAAFKNACIEDSFFWECEATGVQLKSRPDAYTYDYWIDLKTTSSIKDFHKNAFSYGYHRQAALAREALRKLRGVEYCHFIFVVVEESYPYLTASFALDEDSLKKGQEEYLRAAQIYKECLDKNEWNDYGSAVQQLYLPKWL